jgi:hypothetical protein
MRSSCSVTRSTSNLKVLVIAVLLPGTLSDG